MKYITYIGHHNQFECMLAQVANLHRNIGLFRLEKDLTGSTSIEKCGLGENETLTVFKE